MCSLVTSRGVNVEYRGAAWGIPFRCTSVVLLAAINSGCVSLARIVAPTPKRVSDSFSRLCRNLAPSQGGAFLGVIAFALAISCISKTDRVAPIFQRMKGKFEAVGE